MIARIQLILKTKNISPTRFADTIQVQRSGISHILSGRNKPSLDFVMKILSSYTEINSDWLLFGKGEMFQASKSGKRQEEITTKSKKLEVNQIEKDEGQPEHKNKNDQTQKKSVKGKNEIERIIVFYKDNSFQEYSPQ